MKTLPRCRVRTVAMVTADARKKLKIKLSNREADDQSWIYLKLVVAVHRGRWILAICRPIELKSKKLNWPPCCWLVGPNNWPPGQLLQSTKLTSALPSWWVRVSFWRSICNGPPKSPTCNCEIQWKNGRGRQWSLFCHTHKNGLGFGRCKSSTQGAVFLHSKQIFPFRATQFHREKTRLLKKWKFFSNGTHRLPPNSTKIRFLTK